MPAPAAAGTRPSGTRSHRRLRRHHAGIAAWRTCRPVLQPGVAGESRRAGLLLQIDRVLLRTPISRASADTSRSAGRTNSGEASPSAITGTPASRSLLRHSPSQAMPSPITASPQGGMCGTSSVAAGQAAVVRATYRIASAPQPIGTYASQSSPNGISSRAISPAGITQSAVSGTATMLATTK